MKYTVNSIIGILAIAASTSHASQPIPPFLKEGAKYALVYNSLSNSAPTVITIIKHTHGDWYYVTGSKSKIGFWVNIAKVESFIYIPQTEK